jgi:hypothetical protein
LQRRADRRCATRAHARQTLEPAIVGRQFERLEGLHTQFVVYPVCQFGTHAGNGAEQRVGIGFAAQPLELRPAAGAEQLGDGGGDSRADTRQRIQAGLALGGVDVTQCSRQLRHHVARPAVGRDAVGVVTLRVEQHGHFAQGLCDRGIVDRPRCRWRGRRRLGDGHGTGR